MHYNNFVNTVLRTSNLDNYIVRDSILNSIKVLQPKLRGQLLDVGCGQMPYKALLTSGSSQVTKYIGLDLENNPIHKNKPDITWKHGKVPLDDCSVDCAIATEVFEHCPEPKEVMIEISRVLKPGGLLFFTVPFLWPLHEVPYDEYRYTPFALKRLLFESGFSNIKLKALGGWDASFAQMIGLWARRRPMGKLKRILFSLILMPFVYVLYQMDKKQETKFLEGPMITGISGIALKIDTNKNLEIKP